jgi:hypothetical protein
MTTNPASRKTTNLVANPNVSLLVHDCKSRLHVRDWWTPNILTIFSGVSHRPPTHGRRPSGGSPGPEHRSSLASLLLNLNTSALSSISATIGGAARLVPSGTEEEKYYREQHLENNTFDESAAQPFQRDNGPVEDGGRNCFVAGEEVRVVSVDIKDVRISDWKGTVRDWAIVPEGNLVNGTQ